MKAAVFWDVALCSSADIERRFKVFTAVVLMKKAVSAFETLISICQKYMATSQKRASFIFVAVELDISVV
jgi:hypothetical protein